MDWGIDPARVAEISTIASSRRFSARDTEKFVLAITGGGSENADLPLWDMLQVLFSLGALTANPRMPARDAAIGCLLLVTSHETMLDDLVSRRLDEGDVLSNANTLIYLGKVRDGNRIGRALYIAKHRGSACDERIVSYSIGGKGLAVEH